MRATRDTVSNVEGREISLHMHLPRVTGIKLQAAAWQGHMPPLAPLLPSAFRVKWSEATRRAAYQKVGSTEIYGLVQMDSGTAQRGALKVSWKYYELQDAIDAYDIPLGPIKTFKCCT